MVVIIIKQIKDVRKNIVSYFICLFKLVVIIVSTYSDHIANATATKTHMSVPASVFRVNDDMPRSLDAPFRS